MFKKLRNKIIIITMAITTVVLVLAGSSIMFFSSTIRPEPRPAIELTITNAEQQTPFSNQILNEYIQIDRREGNTRLLTTLLGVGIIIEVAVFLISYYLSQKIVAPVQDSYDKQKLFIANASHELKTPLAVIQANMEALEVEKSGEKWKNNIETEIAHANKLVLNLLQLAKMDNGDIGKTPSETFDLAAELRGHVEIFKPKFSGKIFFKANTKASEYTLPKQDLMQVVDILLDNATKYGDKKVTVSLNQNSIVVANDGTTIPKSDRGKVFDRFYQTDKTKEGSGLGLAIAKAICENNNWNISCESSNHLTKFQINL